MPFFDHFGGSETQKMNFPDVGVWLTSDVPASVCVLDNAIVMIYECLARAVESCSPTPPVRNDSGPYWEHQM